MRSRDKLFHGDVDLRTTKAALNMQSVNIQTLRFYSIGCLSETSAFISENTSDKPANGIFLF